MNKMVTRVFILLTVMVILSSSFPKRYYKELEDAFQEWKLTLRWNKNDGKRYFTRVR
jgi:hypothetical protein